MFSPPSSSVSQPLSAPGTAPRADSAIVSTKIADRIEEIYRDLKHPHDPYVPDILPLFNIRDYGAIGSTDGSSIAADDAGINAANTAADDYFVSSGGNRGILWVPRVPGGGSYYLSSTFTAFVPILMQEQAAIVGPEGATALVLDDWLASDYGEAYVSGGGAGVNIIDGRFCRWIEGITINTTAFGGSKDAYGLYIHSSTQGVLGRRLRVEGALAAVRLVDANNCQLDVDINFVQDGIRLDGSSSDNIINGNIRNFSGYAFNEVTDMTGDGNKCGALIHTEGSYSPSYTANSGASHLVGAHSSCGQTPGSFEEIHLSVWGNDATVAGNAVDVKLPLGSFTDSDVGGLTPSSGVVTIGTSARYEVSFDVKFDPATDDGYVEAEVRFGAAADAPDTFGGWLIDTERVEGEPATSDFIFLNNSRVFELVAGDRMELYCRVSNSNDGNCSVHGNLTVTWVGPTSRTTSLFA